MISFRPLRAADLPTIHEWLQRPHVAEWWTPTSSWEEVQRDFAPEALAAERVSAWIAVEDDMEIGYIQSYIAMGAGGGWWPDEHDPGVRGIDQFLANAAQLGQGLGTRMVRAFVDRLFTDPAVTRIQTDPSPDNPRAIRCYEKAGFRAVREIDTPDGRALLMIAERPR